MNRNYTPADVRVFAHAVEIQVRIRKGQWEALMQSGRWEWIGENPTNAMSTLFTLLGLY